MGKLVVERLFPESKGPFATEVWASERVRKMLVWYQKKKEQHRGQFLKKMLRYAQEGFSSFTGDGRPISHEWDQVYRIGDSSLFRVVGFFVPGTNRFIACDAYLKSGQKLDADERERISNVAAVRACGGFERV